MKKTTVALTVASVIANALFAGEYGFRDFLVNQNRNFVSVNESTTIMTHNAINDIGTYCAIQGGNIEGTISTDLGSYVIKLYTDEEMNKLQSMSKDERLAKYKDSYDRNFNNEFINKSKTYDMGTHFECKLPSNQSIFTAQHKYEAGTWIVVHDKETIEDRAYYTVFTGNKDADFMGTTTRKGRSTEIKKTLNAEYPTYNSFFDDWQNGFFDKAKKTKQGDNYSFRQTFRFGYTSDLADMMNELEETQYFCEAKNGEFLKDGKPFREFLKDFYLGNANVGQDTFKGVYACKNTPEAFTLQLSTYMPNKNDHNSFFMGNALIQKGEVSADNLLPATRNTATKKGMSPDELGLVYKVIMQKTPTAIKRGLALETAVYEGKDSNGCDLAYIEKHIVTIPNSSETFKYKSCNGNITVRQ